MRKWKQKTPSFVFQLITYQLDANLINMADAINDEQQQFNYNLCQ